MGKKKKNKVKNGGYNSKSADQVAKQLEDAKALAGRFGPGWDDLVKFSDPYTNEQASLLNQLGARAGVDPNNPDAFAGNIPQDLKDVLGWGKNRIDPNSDNYVGKRSADVTDILNRMKSGLEGYAAPELQGFREAAQREIDRQTQTQMRRASDTAARYGVRGAAAQAQANQFGRQNTEQQQQLEQDLFTKNADERWRRLGDYGSAVRGAEGDEFSRVQSATGDWTNQFNTANNDAWSKGQEAMHDYANWMQQLSQNNMELQKANADQQILQKNGQASDLNAAGLINAQDQLNYARRMNGGNRRNGGTGRGQRPGATGVDPRQAAIDRMTDIGRKRANAAGVPDEDL